MELRTVADLFERHHLPLFRYAYRHTRRRDLAEDIVQEVFVRVMRSRDTYDERQREIAWLLTIARRLLIDRSRTLSRRPTEAFSQSEPCHEQSAETSLLLDEALAAVHEPDREAFLLKEIGGLTYEEIARVSEITVDGVRSRIYRARMRLRDSLSSPARIVR